MNNILSSKLRIEKSKLNTGFINLNKIGNLKNRHYFTVDVTLDGDAPKQFIKAYFYCKNISKVRKPELWNGYYAKFGGKAYPHESVVEFCINRIGNFLGLVMNETELVIANRQIRFLSKNFLAKGERLIHGIEIIAEYLEDFSFVEEINNNRKDRREFLTFDLVEESIKHVYPEQSNDLLRKLIHLITFDAIVGNNDRHFYNWGVIGNTVKKNDEKVKFAPIYDSARGLLWNLDDGRVVEMLARHKAGSNEVHSYLDRSKPRFSFDENANANHFQLIKFLSNHNIDYKRFIQEMCTIEVQKTVIENFKNEFEGLFRQERIELMMEVLT